MMVGASLADVAFLVISAAQGEFEAGISRGGMTREESLVAYAVGIRRFIVLVTKMELANYSQTRFEEISHAALAYLKQIGIPGHVPVIPVSGLVGDNLVVHSDNILLLFSLSSPLLAPLFLAPRSPLPRSSLLVPLSSLFFSLLVSLLGSLSESFDNQQRYHGSRVLQEQS
jgi:hypothetical protein